ncbi:MAG: hypothetical protein RI894_1900 [Bacteroidota bacterium]|jgi:DNA polymerase-3 subunit epsilon
MKNELKTATYAIIDIETTGGTAAREKITEIAIILHDGERVLDTYSTLINPERSIPYNIIQLTGITNEMVADAPKFYEVAKDIVAFTKDCIFVAHNVQFDYDFVQTEFKRLGFVYQRRRLCTVRLGRSIIPGYKSYSLGNITRELGISLLGAHRAMNDAQATAKLFEILVKKDVNNEIESMLNHGVVATRLPKTVSMEMLQALPESCGVYYFYNANKEVIYVGKSINIRKRIMEHLANKQAKAQRMIASIHDITYTVTGSELVALLLESHEIKTLKPNYNKAQKPRAATYDLFYWQDEKGYYRLETAKTPSNVEILASYPSHTEAKIVLKTLQRNYGLCANLCTTLPSERACFLYHVGDCKGACLGKETPEEYNEKPLLAIRSFRPDRFSEDFFLVEEGRNLEELAIILIKNKEYQGYGYIDKDAAGSEWYDAIEARKHNYSIVQIVREYMQSSKKWRKITL